MSIRNEALLWFERNHGNVDAPTFASKFYQAFESWPKTSVWWIQISRNVVEENLSGHINMLCQVIPDENDFYYLKVPAKFLHDNLDKFHFVGDKISLYFSTHPKTLFIEERGKGKLDFEQFLVKKVEMSDSSDFLTRLADFPSVNWINQYFDLVKKLLTELNIEPHDPRVALTMPDGYAMPVNIGNRWMMQPCFNEYVRCTVPLQFEEAVANATFLGYFTQNKQNDAKWVEVSFPENSQFPALVYNACVDACMNMLKRTAKSNLRKLHVDLIYDFIMEPSVRNELLNEIKIKKG